VTTSIIDLHSNGSLFPGYHVLVIEPFFIICEISFLEYITQLKKKSFFFLEKKESSMLISWNILRGVEKGEVGYLMGEVANKIADLSFSTSP